MNSLARRLGVAFLLPLIVLSVWYLPLLVSLIKPSLNHKNPQISVEGKDSKKVETNTFYYPRLNIQAPITNDPKTSPLNVQQWSSIREALKNGVSLAYNSTDFQKTSLAFITGHSSDLKPSRFSSVFAGLGQAQIGDSFDVVLNDSYHYIVVDKKIISPTNEQAFLNLQSKDLNIQRVVLVTCWPLLTTRNRLVIIGERHI